MVFYYFTKYIDDQMSPWGLRIQMFPTINKLEPEFKSQWEQNLQQCSVKMMEMLCCHYTNELTLLDREIETLYEVNKSITLDALFPSCESALRAVFESYVSEILKTKKNFMRDKLSYDNS